MEVNETISINGLVKIGEKVVAQANASVSSQTGTATSYNESINDYITYVANLEECRAQFDEFQEIVRAKEDDMLRLYHGKVDEPIEEELEEEPEEEPIEDPEVQE